MSNVCFSYLRQRPISIEGGQWNPSLPLLVNKLVDNIHDIRNHSKHDLSGTPLRQSVDRAGNEMGICPEDMKRLPVHHIEFHTHRHDRSNRYFFIFSKIVSNLF